MLWVRMVATAVRLVWPDVLRPWRSPLLRWRLETFGILDEEGRPLAASSMTPRVLFRFVRSHPRQLVQFLRWAASLKQMSRG